MDRLDTHIAYSRRGGVQCPMEAEGHGGDWTIQRDDKMGVQRRVDFCPTDMAHCDLVNRLFRRGRSVAFCHAASSRNCSRRLCFDSHNGIMPVKIGPRNRTLEPPDLTSGLNNDFSQVHAPRVMSDVVRRVLPRAHPSSAAVGKPLTTLMHSHDGKWQSKRAGGHAIANYAAKPTHTWQ